MLKLSFSIKNIQNPFQRHYCRGQTILSFEQNLIQDTDEIRKKLFTKTIKIIVKDNISQTVLSFDQDLFWSKDKITTLFFSSNSSKREKGWIRSNQISSFVRKMIKTFLKGQYRSNHIVPNSNFLKIFET